MTESLRCELDVGRRIYNCIGERFDVYAVLSASTRFVGYAKTLAGLAQFFHKELPRQCVRLSDDGKVLLQYGCCWVPMTPVDFLKLLFLPLYHCNWDDTANKLRDSVLRGDTNADISKLVSELVGGSLPVVTQVSQSVQGSVKLEDVPEDWRDLLLDYIKKGAVDLSKYHSVADLEHRVDQLEGLIEADDSPELDPIDLPPEDPLPVEEREVLARTLRLDPSEFKTKREAMELYAQANR